MNLIISTSSQYHILKSYLNTKTEPHWINSTVPLQKFLGAIEIKEPHQCICMAYRLQRKSQYSKQVAELPKACRYHGWLHLLLTIISWYNQKIANICLAFSWLVNCRFIAKLNCPSVDGWESFIDFSHQCFHNRPGTNTAIWWGHSYRNRCQPYRRQYRGGGG